MKISTRGCRALGLALVALVIVPLGLVTGPAQGYAPHGSRAEVILETGTEAVGDPGYAVVDGWWGHEGPKHDHPTFISLNAAGPGGQVTPESIAALHTALGDGGNFDSLRVAFVPASAAGTTERPVVHAGETAGEAFKWWTDLDFGAGLSGTKNSNDFVTFLSTEAQWDAYFNQGRRLQSFDDKLVLHDDQYDNKVSTDPEGSSILDTWPAGTKVSLVLYVSDGYNKELEPLVKVGPDGRAMSSWLTFRTVAKPGDPVRTSAGYQILTASKGDGDKLVNGLPPANEGQASASPGTSSAGASTSPGSGASGSPAPGSASSAAALSGGGSTPTSATTHATGFGHAVRSPWPWLVLVAVLAIAAGLILRRRSRLPHLGTTTPREGP